MPRRAVAVFVYIGLLSAINYAQMLYVLTLTTSNAAAAAFYTTTMASQIVFFFNLITYDIITLKRYLMEFVHTVHCKSVRVLASTGNEH